MAEKILEMKNVSKRFGGVYALSDVSLTIHKGEIHALIGENGAGKSTLMKILLGIHRADGGEIYFKGNKVAFQDPSHALNSGISMIHQEISLVPELTVAENIWLGREKKFMKAGVWIDTKARNEEAQKLLTQLDIDLKPSALVKDLSVAQMQLTELVRSVSYDPSLIIMDEPTSALTDSEITILYRLVRNLAAKGVTVIFISHKLEEIYEICDTVTVLRDGCLIKTDSTLNLKMDELMNLIAGRKLTKIHEKEQTELGDVVLEVKDLCSDIVNHVSLQVRKGQILGISGLMGAGRSEILRAIFGIDKKTSGTILVEGKEVQIHNTTDAVKNNIAMVTEDRLRMGCIQTMSVKENTTLAYFYRLCNKLGFYSPKEEEEKFKSIGNRLAVKYDNPDSMIGSLSGGNQQKVIIGRWMMTNPKILLLDEPTRGIDVGSKSEIYRLINNLAKEGMAIIMVSSELPEILALSDRIAVVRDGRIVHECGIEGATQEKLMSYAFGLEQEDKKNES